ncbi:MAG: hypothetical protein ACP5HG_05475 [Anaerolineae bacterium]
MSRLKVPFAVLMIAQVVAILIYPPAYFQRNPQAAIMPPGLLILFVLGIVGINTGTLSLEGTRSLLIFIQGVNIVVRLMSFFPNLKTPSGEWAWALLIAHVVGLALSWFTLVRLGRLALPRFRRLADSQDGAQG